MAIRDAERNASKISGAPMVYATEGHVQRASEHIECGDVEHLRYACLELRLALERIAYQKLQLRLDDIAIEEIRGWQPKRVIDALMELVDPALDQDAKLSVGARLGGGNPETDVFTPVGVSKGVHPKKIGKYWHKLGSFLHMSMPSKKGERPKVPDASKLCEFLQEVAGYVDEITSTGFDAHFSEKVTLTCSACNQLTVRNSKLLKEYDIVQCQNPACRSSYKTSKDGEQFIFEHYTIDLPCKRCDETMRIVANELLDLPYNHAAVVLCECNARHQVCWAPQYGLLDDDTEARSTASSNAS